MSNVFVYTFISFILSIFWGLVMLLFRIPKDIASLIAIIVFIFSFCLMQLSTFGDRNNG